MAVPSAGAPRRDRSALDTIWVADRVGLARAVCRASRITTRHRLVRQAILAVASQLHTAVDQLALHARGGLRHEYARLRGVGGRPVGQTSRSRLTLDALVFLPMRRT